MLQEAGVCIEIARGNQAAIVMHDDGDGKDRERRGDEKKGAIKFKDKLEEAIKESEGVEESSIKATDKLLNAAVRESSRAKSSSFRSSFFFYKS